MDAFLGTIIPVTFDFAPANWALCNGQILPINQYNALFSVLGTTYGGDGRTTFGLPDLCGRTAVGAQGTALPPAPTLMLGQIVGETALKPTVTGNATATVKADNLPQVTVSGTIAGASLTAKSVLNATGNGPGPTTPAPGASAPSAGAMLSNTGTTGAVYLVNPNPATPLPSVALNGASVSTALFGSPSVTASIGSGTALTTPVTITASSAKFYPMQPSLALNYIICVNGLYPVRP